MGIYLLTAPLDGFAHQHPRALVHGQIAVVVYQAPHAMMMDRKHKLPAGYEFSLPAAS